jgi:hypothetical protein
VAVANGAREQIDGRGLFLGEPADYVKNFDCSLYSVSQFVHSGDRVCIFEKGRMFGIDCSVNKSLIAAYQECRVHEPTTTSYHPECYHTE